ncbi:MAG: NYN domain-containing protein, partial [Acidimicrobiales bacterium]|nr:NYN domain-containing protein [Acidimicrobiales bacterium]
LLVVDGYNLARARWSQLAPEEERRRTVALLEDLQARSAGTVVVVFDGDDSVAAPAASRSVRVRFSATGQTADEAIAALVAGVPDAQPVVVVSSDREVADDARRLGAVALSSPDLLAAAGR